jgi:hypothetical protein
VKIAQIASAVGPSSLPLTATIPPKAETLSHASAWFQASSRLSALATPHGLACLTITTVGGPSRNSAASSSAALASFRLL